MLRFFYLLKKLNMIIWALEAWGIDLGFVLVNKKVILVMDRDYNLKARKCVNNTRAV